MKSSRIWIGIGIATLLGAGAAAVWNLSSGEEPAPRELASSKSFKPPASQLKGLVRRPAGPCGLLYEVEASGPNLCTHGPDAPPEDLDPSSSRPLESPREETNEILAGLPENIPVVPSGQFPCYGDGISGPRVQAIYTVASDRQDKFAVTAPYIPAWALRVETVISMTAAATGGVRHIRFVTDDECKLVVDKVELSATGDDTFVNTINELKALGYNRTDRKYMIWADADVYCGIGSAYWDDRPDVLTNYSSKYPGYARVDGTVGGDGYVTGCWGAAETHELMHALGAVQKTAPHNGGNSSHCFDESDTMCYDDGYTGPMKKICNYGEDEFVTLDCNKDDYFNTNPPSGSYLALHWNTAKSIYLTSETPSNAVEKVTATGEACTIIGTEGNDRITGTKGPDVICGLGGDDTVLPDSGADVVDGGLGSDTLSYAGTSDDLTLDLQESVQGETTKGSATDSSGNSDLILNFEHAVGGFGSDEIHGSEAANRLRGGIGQDVLYGDGGDDRLVGKSGTDTGYGGPGNDLIDLGTGQGDRAYGATGSDKCLLGTPKHQRAFKCES